MATMRFPSQPDLALPGNAIAVVVDKALRTNFLPGNAFFFFFFSLHLAAHTSLGQQGLEAALCCLLANVYNGHS